MLDGVESGKGEWRWVNVRHVYRPFPTNPLELHDLSVFNVQETTPPPEILAILKSGYFIHCGFVGLQTVVWYSPLALFPNRIYRHRIS